MKVTCVRDNLLPAVADACRAVNGRSAVEILRHVLVTADDGVLVVTGTNLETCVMARASARVEQPGEVTVPYKTIRDLINTLTDDMVHLELSPRTLTLGVECGDTQSNIKGLSAQEFAQFTVPNGQPLAEIETESLKRMIEMATLSVATDESRPMLTGVYCELVGDELIMSAADGYRLTSTRMRLTQPVRTEIAFLVPGNAMAQFIRQNTNSETFGIIGTERQAFLTSDDRIVVAQLLNMQFPDYTQIIPTTHTTRIVVNRKDLLAACRAANVFARDGANTIKMSIASGRVRVTGKSHEAGDHAAEVDGKVEGDEIDIAFNAKYIIDVLRVSDEDKMVIEMNGPEKPGAFKPNPGTVHVIMPMHDTAKGD